MSIFDVLTLIGGLAMFLFGMNLMGSALERRAGRKLHSVLSKMTTNKAAGLLTGCGVTAVIQSSSATTVMVVGFVNSGLMTLRQAINVIMGANVGTTITGWILSLSGIDGSSLWVQMLKPSSFTPVLALIGIIYYMFCKKSSKKDTGMILLGFATLMFGMETMTGAVSGLSQVPAFRDLFIMFKNPVLGLFAGAVLTAVIQSSSASVGILQALAMTGAVPFGAAIPIIMGDAIGTCVTAMLSSVGAKKEAKRAAVVHLSFNIIGAFVWMVVFSIVRAAFAPAILDKPATIVGIAVVNTAFKILSTALLLPMSSVLEKIAGIIVPDSRTEEEIQLLDERLLATPSVAIDRCRTVAVTMAELSVAAMQDSFRLFTEFDGNTADFIRDAENKVDYYEDKLGSYLVRLSSHSMTEADSNEASELLHMISDFERISDHAVNIMESAEEMHDKKLSFSAEAQGELAVMMTAVSEIMELSLAAFRENNMDSAVMVEPLEQVVDTLKEKVRKRHILRLQNNGCTIELGFILTDLLTNLERVSDHCSNIAGCILEMQLDSNMDVHEYLRKMKSGDAEEFNNHYDHFSVKYALPASK